ncbi:MAG: DUF2796 domain-containing protein [Pseudomonadota bacterium]
MTLRLAAVALCCAGVATADETRELSAHVHGHGELNIAIDGVRMAITLIAPGADIVGFEYEAKSDEDLAAVETAIATLSDPTQLFIAEPSGACQVVRATVELIIEGPDDHDHGDEHAAHDDHAHDDHDHDHDHAAHDDHDHDHDHAAHDDHGHDEVAEASHSEFQADYLLECAEIESIQSITFPYFEIFAGAEELDIQIVTASGASAAEVTRETARLDLSSLM